MSCSLYNNNGYGCGGCIHFVKTNSVTLQGNVLTLNIPQASYSNKKKSMYLYSTDNTKCYKCRHGCYNNRGRSNTISVKNKMW